MAYGAISMGMESATEFLFTERLSRFGLRKLGGIFASTEMEASTRPVQHACWNWGSDRAPTAPTSFAPISGDFHGEPQQELVQTTSDMKCDDAGISGANTCLSQTSHSFGFQQF